MMKTALEHLIGVTASKKPDPIQVRFEPVLPVIHLNRDRWNAISELPPAIVGASSPSQLNPSVQRQILFATSLGSFRVSSPIALKG